ncbi:hypothetical protein [Pseudotabrizicola algicola]|uniref:Uncharacterized protein n=1 Tax=Pseudotabrizicola algicola TaxID=2709381 RepID=A0A6B3RGU8_9RHOB|nr:hypothetical protein [Pseudotabrizicola algicola]NEX45257.1 hypothetical protein [Pseudotabrizicola algicola]
MSQISRKPELLDLLALNIGHACEAARAVSGADGCRLRLGEALDWMRPRLAGAGVVLCTEKHIPEDAGASRETPIHNLPMPPGSPTDLVCMGIDLRDSTGNSIGLLALRGVPAAWATRDRIKALESLASLLANDIGALIGGPSLLAEPVLRLVTMIRDLDDHAVSHALGGLLRVLAGKQPSKVEAMAMRICGLAGSTHAYLENREIVLSPAAEELLDRAGMGRTSEGLVFTPVAANDAVECSLPVPHALEAFARVRILNKDFDVAEAETSGQYWYRETEAEQTAWAPLANGASDGWTAIAAEILTESRDVAAEYAKMNIIRRRDLPTDEVAEAYELNGIVWWMRQSETTVEARLASGEWQSCGEVNDGTVKACALSALLKIAPRTLEDQTDQVRDWVRRMAHSVQVLPYMAVAAE